MKTLEDFDFYFSERMKKTNEEGLNKTREIFKDIKNIKAKVKKG